jgi:hypothetical protein
LKLLRLEILAGNKIIDNKEVFLISVKIIWIIHKQEPPLKRILFLASFGWKKQTIRAVTLKVLKSSICGKLSSSIWKKLLQSEENNIYKSYYCYFKNETKNNNCVTQLLLFFSTKARYSTHYSLTM